MNINNIKLALTNSPLFDGFAILILYYFFFGFVQNPIREFRLLQNGTKQMATVDYIDGLDSNKSNSTFLMHPYNYSFVSVDGKKIKSSQWIFLNLQDQPVTAKPKFSANITYLNSNPNVSQFTSTISTSYSDFFFRRVLLSFLFVSILYFLVKLSLIIDYKERQMEKQFIQISLN